MKDLGADKWTVQTGETGDVRLNSNKDDNEEHKYCEHADGETHTLNVAHDIKLSDCFTDLPQNITGIRIEVLNTAGTYTGQNGDQPAKDERDTYINGREIWVMTGEGKESKLSGLTAYADFETENGCGIENLVDGIITKDKKMSSLLQPASGETKTLGKLTYVPGTANGSIWRCNIYTSNVTLESGKKPADIPAESWELAYTNVPTEKEDGTLNTSKDWEEYNGSLSALGNAQDAVFEAGFKDARYVRMEVINTRGSGTENKWINIGRVYIYEAEAVYTGTVENAALSGSGNNKGTSYNYWVGTADLRQAAGQPNTNGEVGYMVVDLGDNIASVDLEETTVKRYVRIVFTEYGGTGTYTNPAARAFEIHGIKHTGTLGNIDLTLENEPVYMGILRQPYSPAGAEYHMDSYDWYKGSGDSAELLDKKTD